MNWNENYLWKILVFIQIKWKKEHTPDLYLDCLQIKVEFNNLILGGITKKLMLRYMALTDWTPGCSGALILRQRCFRKGGRMRLYCPAEIFRDVPEEKKKTTFVHPWCHGPSRVLTLELCAGNYRDTTSKLKQNLKCTLSSSCLRWAQAQRRRQCGCTSSMYSFFCLARQSLELHLRRQTVVNDNGFLKCSQRESV